MSTTAVKPIVFTGNTREYFSIWIVNILLTILTLGVYSAWAKVRNMQYFYGNTMLDGNAFRYTAEPKQILKGRMIAVLLFIAYSVVSTISPMAGAAFFIALMLLVPAMVVMSMSLNPTMMKMICRSPVTGSVMGSQGALAPTAFNDHSEEGAPSVRAELLAPAVGARCFSTPAGAKTPAPTRMPEGTNLPAALRAAKCQ